MWLAQLLDRVADMAGEQCVAKVWTQRSQGRDSLLLHDTSTSAVLQDLHGDLLKRLDLDLL